MGFLRLADEKGKEEITNNTTLYYTRSREKSPHRVFTPQNQEKKGGKESGKASDPFPIYPSMTNRGEKKVEKDNHK